jgi:hypothetical protein
VAIVFGTDNSRAGGVSVIVGERLIPLAVQMREVAKMAEACWKALCVPLQQP